MSKSPTRVRTATLPSRRRAIDTGAAGSGPIRHPAWFRPTPAGHAGHRSSAPRHVLLRWLQLDPLTASGRARRTRHAIRSRPTARSRPPQWPSAGPGAAPRTLSTAATETQGHTRSATPRPPERTATTTASPRDRGRGTRKIAADGGERHHRHCDRCRRGPTAVPASPTAPVPAHVLRANPREPARSILITLPAPQRCGSTCFQSTSAPPGGQSGRCPSLPAPTASARPVRAGSRPR